MPSTSRICRRYSTLTRCGGCLGIQTALKPGTSSFRAWRSVSAGVRSSGAGGLPRWFLVSRPLIPVAAALLATLTDGMVRFALLQLFHYPAPFAEVLSRVIVPQAGYNALLATVAVIVPSVRARA